jgi:diguanylate cyclase (GGDEF)-like protein
LGKDPHELFHARRPDGQPYPAEHCPLHRALEAGQKVRQDDVFWRRDGLPVPVHVSASPRVEHDRVMGAVVAFHDITEEMRLLEELRRLAAYDPLTGLANRGHLEQRLQEAQSAAQRHKRPAALLMFDLDHFKKVNDTYGHQAGDDVLRALARLVSTHAIQYDGFSARYGGEELVVVMPGMDLDRAAVKAEALRADVERYDFRVRTNGQLSETPLKFTVSVGVARMKVGWNSGDLIGAADGALYQAKNSGRNRACSAPK